jgi:ketosteroid isomerase-like protein
MLERTTREFFEAVSEGDLERVGELLAEDCLMVFPGERFGVRLEGKRRVSVFFKSNRRLFRDGLRFELSWVGVCGDRAVAQWTNAGCTRAGADYANRGATILSFDEDGRVAEIQDYLDTERLAATWPK